MPRIPKRALRHFIRVCIIILSIISLRVWYLSVIQKDYWVSKARKPQRRSILEHANRGTIRDRFGLPLALNRIRYNAAIYYAHIKQIPYIEWKKNEEGKKIKYYPRREHISLLAKVLAEELALDPDRVEDSIHSKASLFPHTPFIIKENISEEKYFRLRMLEKDWIGLHAEIEPERFYPNKKLGADVIGYMGAISQKHYLQIAEEIKTLQTFLEEDKQGKEPLFPPGFGSKEEIELRLEELKERAYTFHDLVGKFGLEGKYEEILRGFHGKTTFSVDVKGNFLKELAYKEPVSGNRISTTLSLELQEFAEKLLGEDEKQREGKSRIWDSNKRESVPLKQPWIKGGAIVALDPNTGEILALASHPRFDPNDFIPSSNKKLKEQKNRNIHKWFETSSHIASIWNGKDSLSREFFSSKKKTFIQEIEPLTWELYLDLILPKEGPLKLAMEKIKSVKNAIEIQEAAYDLLYFSKQNRYDLLFDNLFQNKDTHFLINPHIDSSSLFEIDKQLLENKAEVNPRKNVLHKFLSSITDNVDKLFVVDLCRVAINSYAFSDALIEKVGSLSLTSYWKISKAILNIQDDLRKIMKPIFHEKEFIKWREENFKSFLKEKRQEEKEKNTYARPYLDYLDEEESKQFNHFWERNRLLFLTIFFQPSSSRDKTPTSLSFYIEKLKIISEKAKDKENDLHPNYSLAFSVLKDLSFDLALEFIKTVRSFSDLDRPLLRNYPYLRKTSKRVLEKDLAAAFYPRSGFGYGVSSTFRESAPLGSLFKITTAYCALKQRYNYLIENHLPLSRLNPFTMIDKIAWDQKKQNNFIVGYSLDKKPYYRFYKGGRLPRSSHPDMGKIDLITAIEQSSNPYFALLAGDFIKDPDDLLEATRNLGFGSKVGIELPGEIEGNLPSDLQYNKTGLYSFAIGQHSLVVTPLQTAVMLSTIANKGKVFSPTVLKNSPRPNYQEIFLPDCIRNTLIDGLHQVVIGERGNARTSIIKKLRFNHELKKLYNDLKTSFVGKTSTAEIMYNPDSHPSGFARKYKHLWFGAIGFDPQLLWDKPEIVVVVYLKYGDGGKEAAPLAAQMIQKYREIKAKHEAEQ